VKAVIKENNVNSIKSNRIAVICATGPSVSNVDFGKFFDADFYSVSNFFLHDEIDDIAPKVHCFAPYHEPLIKEEFISWLQKSDNCLPESTKILLSISDKEMIEENKLFLNRDVIYVALEKAQFGRMPNITKPLMKPQTSPLMLLPVIMQMKYEEIYFVGCDHNILKNYGGVVDNFYESRMDVRNNATSGDNWKAGIIKHLSNATNVFEQYKFYIDLGEDVKFFNTSKDSWLDFIEYTDKYSKKRL
jgi:hypothetical protein